MGFVIDECYKTFRKKFCLYHGPNKCVVIDGWAESKKQLSIQP